MQDPVPTRQDPEESPEPIDRLIHRALCLAGLVPAVAFGGWVAVGVFRALAYRSLRYGEEGYGDASSSEILWDVVSFLLSVILVPLLVVGVPLFFWKLLRLGPQGRFVPRGWQAWRNWLLQGAAKLLWIYLVFKVGAWVFGWLKAHAGL